MNAPDFETAKALCALVMVSDPTPLSADEDSMVTNHLNHLAREFGFGSWEEMFHAKEPNKIPRRYRYQFDEFTCRAIRDNKGSPADVWLHPSLLRETGQLVRVSSCKDDEPGTHLGVLLGDLPRGLVFNETETEELRSLDIAPSGFNPAMYVPALNRVVMGIESWWDVIDDPAAEIADLTEEEIASSPAMVLLQAFADAFAQREANEQAELDGDAP